MSQLPQLSALQTRINAFLLEKIEALELTDDKLKQAMSYGLLIGGKRLRPYLVYITGQSVDISLGDLDVVAAAIECIHAYSLLHDDLPAMDDDDLRRGKPTCHIVYDEATAILAGDSLQTLAFDLLANAALSPSADAKRIELIRLLTKASGYEGMCGGQAIDLASTNNPIDLSTLENMHKLKTGALLKACILMAVCLSPSVTSEQKVKFAEFADKIGLAYQVRDDVIDIISDQETLGKPSGSDIEANKTTYPSLLGLNNAQQKAEALYQESLQALAGLPYNTRNLSDFATFIIERKS